jgi:hypothetical protein
VKPLRIVEVVGVVKEASPPRVPGTAGNAVFSVRYLSESEFRTGEGFPGDKSLFYKLCFTIQTIGFL